MHVPVPAPRLVTGPARDGRCHRPGLFMIHPLSRSLADG